MIGRLLASLSLALRQPLPSFCQVETTHDDALVTRRGEYLTFVRVDGMRRMATRKDVAAMANAQRLDISGALEKPGHAIAAFYISDPDAAAVEIERVNLGPCREAARLVGLDVSDILNERAALWPRSMRWEAAYYVLWTSPAVLNKEDRKQADEERKANALHGRTVKERQEYWLRSDIMAARHAGFVSRIMASLNNREIAAAEITARDALVVMRETLYRETAGANWKPALIGDRVMPSLPEGKAKIGGDQMLWPSLRSQIFHADATTQGGQCVELGDHEYANVDMALGPTDPRSFIELSAALGRDRIPWRAVILLQGGGSAMISIKEAAAEFLGMFPQNADLRRAFQAIRDKRASEEDHISVRMRASFATWVPAGQSRKLRRRSSTLLQRVEGWGNCRATTLSGDPLEGVLSSVPGLALASTGTPALALLNDALAMLPWNRTASPWQRGSVLFRRPDGSLWVYEPSGGAARPHVVDIFVAPPGSGKSILANTINLGLCLSMATLGSEDARLPLIGKLDVGPSAQGFVRLLQEALGPQRRHEAIYVTMQFAPGYEVNIFDLQVGCEFPLEQERNFLQNFLATITQPLGDAPPFEGVNMLIGLVIDEAYRMCSRKGGSPKYYHRGVDPTVDAAIERLGIALDPRAPWWLDVVDGLIAHREYRLAEVAQRHAAPLLEDLITAARTDQVRDMFAKLKIVSTAEDSTALFERYIFDTIKRFPTLNRPTKLDFGPARVIVLDLEAVAPRGSAAAERQTGMMYMLGRYILARNFFLRPQDAAHVPEHVRDYHTRRFTEARETIKRLDYDEWHRTEQCPAVRAQAAIDVREGRKYNLQIAFSSQQLGDFDAGIVSQSTGRFILKCGDESEADELIKRFNLSEASAAILRHSLPGPSATGAPVLMVLQANGQKYEQLVINLLGPIELWALSTTPGDTALRERLYQRLGFSEALRRLTRIFPSGSAQKEIDRRKDERLRQGEQDSRASEGVVQELVRELTDGVGLGIKLRTDNDDAEPEKQAAD